MEQQLLQDMIRERDARIAKIQKQLERQQAQYSKLQHSVANVRVSLAEDSLKNRQEILQLEKAKEAREFEFGRKEKHLKSQSGSLHTYTEMMKLACKENVTSSYVTRAQAQLCRAMHTMGALEHQVVLVEDRCSKLIKSLKDAVAEVVDEKTKMELEVMNELVVLDDAKREAEEEYKGRADEIGGKLSELKKQAGENESESDSEKDEEESVDEEEEEMREMIEEGKKEIARLEAENAKQLEMIETLKKRAAGAEKKAENGDPEEQTPKESEATKDAELEEEDDGRPHLDKEEKVDVGGNQ